RNPARHPTRICLDQRRSVGGQVTAMRILIASTNNHLPNQIGAILAKNRLVCPAGLLVALEAAADRASRLLPTLAILVLPADPEAGFGPMRDICRIVPDVHLLAIGPATDPKLILRALHEGAAEYFDETLLVSELNEALARF